MHVFAARVGAVDPPGGVRGVPLVDGRVELQTGIGALPRCRRQFTPQIASTNGAHDRAILHRVQVPLGVVDDRLHELVADTYGVVGVLVLDAEAVGAVEIHVEAGVAQHTRLALLFGLAPHELLDVGVVDVEDDHLGGTPSLATALDRAGRRVGAAHEADRSACRAATVQQLVAGADVGQVDARSGATLEDHALFAVPVEDAVHRVVDREDEARAGLLGYALDADVEPHRTVERRPLRDEDVLQLVVERLDLGRVDEVAAVDAPPRDRVGDAVDDLAQRRLARRGAERAPEVLLSDDVGGIERPTDRELDVELLEGDRAVLPVADPRVAALPLDLVIRAHAG